MSSVGSLPESRAQLHKSTLQYLRSLEDGAEILAQLRPSVIEAIDQASPRDFLPYAYHLAVLQALWERGGKYAVCDLSAFNVSQSISSPVYTVVRKSFVDTFGLKPATVLSTVPRGMRKSVRHLGRIEVDVDHQARKAKTIWHRMPEMIRHPCVCWGHSSTYPVLLTWAGAVDVSVEVNLSRLDQGEAHYEIDWVE